MTSGRSEALRALIDSPLATVEDGALVIAADAQPGCDVGQPLLVLDELADRVVAKLSRDSSRWDEVGALREVLYDDFGLRGNRAAYDDPRNSFLNEVLQRKLGIPISLAVVVLAVCRRAGVVAEGISFPGHFVVRLGGPGGIVLDPFDNLTPLMPNDLRRILAHAMGGSPETELPRLVGATPREIWIRMLNNLRLIHESRADHGAALLVLNRLVELDAGPTAHRDRGMHALALGANAAAASDLSRYLTILPRAIDRAEVERALTRATKSQESWN